jgi:DHA2 family multidrug resistance protein
MKTEVTGSKLWITVATMLAGLMATIDISIVNVALSDIRASFGTPMDQIGWVSTGYMMANVVIIPLTGWLQRRFGFRRYFTVSILVFTAASALCGMAWNLPSLVLFRMLQGLGGGAIIPTSQAILFARYPREEQTMASAVFALGAITGPLLGPSIGGWLIDLFSWHWIFYINLPVGLIAATLAWRTIQQPEWKPATERIDAFGIGLLAVGMASLQYVLEEGNREGWLESELITVLAVVAAVSLITFVVHELETEHPVVDLRVFANMSYTAGTLINFVVGVALFSGSFLFSLYCGIVMRYSALDIGLVFLTAGIAQVILMPLVGKFGDRTDIRFILAAGMALVATSFWINGHLTADASYWGLVEPQTVRGIGLAFIFVPLGVIALSDLPAELRGNATGLFNLTRELGGSIGTAWMGTMLDRSSRLATARLAERVTAYNPAAQEQLALLKRAVPTVDPNQSAYALINLKVQLQALVKSFNQNFLLVGAVFVAGIALIALLKRPRPGVAIEGAH